MKKIYTYNWEEIQKFYDENVVPWGALQEKFHLTITMLMEAKSLGLFKSLSRSEANSRSRKARPILPSEETKQKISVARKKFLKENPDQVPYLLNHVHKRKFISEEYFKECLKDSGFQQHYRLGTYQLDFADAERKIDLEIDGNQHFVDKRIVEHDKQRNEPVTKLGWTVVRVKWSVFQAATYNEKSEVIQSILAGENPNKDYVFFMEANLDSDFEKYFESEKARKNNISYCSCGTSKHSTSKECMPCSLKRRYHNIKPTLQELKDLINLYPMTIIADKFGVSDNCIRNWCGSYNLDYKKPMGFWLKMKYQPPYGKDELFEMLWSKSKELLGQDTGFHPSSFTKWAKFYDIPNPGADYWSKFRNGHLDKCQAMKQVALEEYNKKGSP